MTSRLVESPTLDSITGLESWDVELRAARVLFGAGRVAQLGPLVKELGGRRVLVVTDAGLEAAGHVATAVDSLLGEGLDAFVFADVAENPTTEHVALGTQSARASEVDFIVGLGGGSSMDCAKGVNFLYTNGGRMEDYWGLNKASRPMLPSIGIPCTAGTGSEAQSFALIAQQETHLKMACGDEKARFRAVILDPELAVTAPREVAAVAGFDALSHAVESYVTKSRNAISMLYAREAWVLLEAAYLRALSGDAEVETWGRMLLGAHLAGAAIEASMLGGAHALANPLTANFGVTHGIAVGLFLPRIVRLNGSVVESEYHQLAEAVALGPQNSSADGLASHLEDLRQQAGLPSRLADFKVDSSDLPLLAEQAMEQWTLQHNPHPLSASEVLEIYQECLE